MASQHQNTVLDADHERSMLEGALTFLVILLSLRLHLGMFLLLVDYHFYVSLKELGLHLKRSYVYIFKIVQGWLTFVNRNS